MGSSSKMSLNLLIDTKNNKVLFAETGKNCIDFLFHLLSLPLGTVMRLLHKQQMIGSLENLYDSIENLDETYIQPAQNKDMFLSPKSPADAPASMVTLLALTNETAPIDKVFYRCSSNCSTYSGNKSYMYVTDDPRAVCPGCSRIMLLATIKYVAPQQTDGAGEINEDGFVKGVVTYMIMDDLEVKPMSAISSIALLNKFNVMDLRVLEEKQVDLCKDEALKLLKASLESKSVLTDVFLDDDDEEKKGEAVSVCTLEHE